MFPSPLQSFLQFEVYFNCFFPPLKILINSCMQSFRFLNLRKTIDDKIKLLIIALECEVGIFRCMDRCLWILLIYSRNLLRGRNENAKKVWFKWRSEWVVDESANERCFMRHYDLSFLSHLCKFSLLSFPLFYHFNLRIAFH